MKNSCCCIIVTYNIGTELDKCFFAIKDQVDEVVIVDNGSNTETVEYIKYLENEYKINVILNKENMGIAYALNQGVKYAIDKKYDWILTMDNDSEATSNMVKSMLDVYNSMDSNEKKKVVGIFPEYLEKGLMDNTNEYKVTSENNFNYIISEITSGNLIKSDTFNKVGFFEEKLFIDYVDHEFCYRIFSKGYKQIKVEKAILLHRLGNTKKKKVLYKDISYTNHSSLRRYYITRNRFYMWNKFKDEKGLQNLIKFDKKAFIKENIKILLFEENKIEKFKMTINGYKDYKNNKFGKINL